MKQTFVYSAIMLALILTSCKKTVQNFVPNCTGTVKTFAADAFPVIQSSCLNCHSSNSNQPLDNYSHIVAVKSSIRSKIIDGTMPQSGSLTVTQKNAVICWIDNGATNN